MNQFVTFILADFSLFPSEGRNKHNYSFNKLLKQAIENSHAIKIATLQKHESNVNRKKTVANGSSQIESNLSYSRIAIPDLVNSEVNQQQQAKIDRQMGSDIAYSGKFPCLIYYIETYFNIICEEDFFNLNTIESSLNYI